MFMHHITCPCSGLLSHNADAFGAPFCTCCDKDGKSQLYDFTRPKRGHYGQLTFEQLCWRAHVAPWEALGQKEPAKWSFTCPCCKTPFSSENGGRTKLEALDTELAKLSEKAQENRLKNHAKEHDGQQLRRGPLLPFHHVVFDPMHGMHNEANAILDEIVHRHLCVDSSDAEVKQIIETAQKAINTLWKEAHLPKFIQFGKDKQGEHSHALNGPAFKAVWRHKTLLMQTIKHMEPVYELLESKRLVPPLEPSALGESADKGPSAAPAKGGKRKATAPPKKPRKKKERGVAFEDIVGENEEEEVEQPSPGQKTETEPRPGPSSTAPFGPFPTPIWARQDFLHRIPDDLHWSQLNSWVWAVLAGVGPAPAGAPAQPTEKPDSPSQPAAPELTYKQRVGAALLTFANFYMFLHKDNGTPVKDIDRTARGDEAAALAIDMQRAMLALIGSHRRRTYAHDLVYGITRSSTISLAGRGTQPPRGTSTRTKT